MIYPFYDLAPMFSSKAKLIRCTGKDGVGRYDYLKLLATEYQTTKSRGETHVMLQWYIYVSFSNLSTLTSFHF